MVVDDRRLLILAADFRMRGSEKAAASRRRIGNSAAWRNEEWVRGCARRKLIYRIRSFITVCVEWAQAKHVKLKNLNFATFMK